ncbi:MAG: butyrate kinase [Bacillota bacterium]|nr:butyrate kinase [Bacillota bacterium]
MKILVMNLGSTSTKLAIFEDENPIVTETIRHTPEELAPYPDILAQEDFRKERILDFLRQKGAPLDSMDVIATRGGLIRPVPGGVFWVDDSVEKDVRSGLYGKHSSNTGLLIANAWSREYGIPAVFTDAPATDELMDVARVSGYQSIFRRSIFHALNMKRVARQCCNSIGIKPEDSRLIIAHMGGGVSVAALKGLKAIDVNGATDGDGPFSPERSGSLPLKQALKVAYQKAKTPEEAFDLFYRKGGLISYFGTNNVAELVKRSETEKEVELVLRGMLYMIAKQIAAMAVPLEGRVDQIILTGGIAYNAGLMAQLSEKVGFIAPVTVTPGEDELAALAEGALRFMRGEEKARRIDE